MIKQITYLCLALFLTVCVFFGIALRYIPFRAIVDPQKKRVLYRIYLLLGILNFASIVLLQYIFEAQGIFSYLRYGSIIFAVVSTAVNTLIIRGKIREHLFIFGIILTCNYLTMTVPNYIITLVNNITVSQALFIIIGLYFLLLLAIYFPLKILLEKTFAPFILVNTSNYWNSLWFLPIVFFATKFVNLGGDHNSGSLAQIISSVLSVFVMVFLCTNIANVYKHMSEKLNMEHQLAEQKLYYAELQTKVEETRRIKHDMKHHISAIRRYIQLDDKEGLSTFCDDLAEKNDLDRAALPYTGNVAVDGVVYKYMTLCKDRGIDFSYSGSIENGGISDMDVTVLIGNALDNAYEAASVATDEKYIRLMCKTEKNLLSIMVSNSFDGKIVADDNNEILSRKERGRVGVGLKSMEAVCMIYGGIIEKSWDDRSFNVLVMLPIKTNKK